MTRDETLKIMAVLKATYPNFYKDMTRRDAEGVVALLSLIHISEPTRPY